MDRSTDSLRRFRARQLAPTCRRYMTVRRRASPRMAQQAVRLLRGFDKVDLRPNEAKRGETTLDPRSFQY